MEKIKLSKKVTNEEDLELILLLYLRRNIFRSDVLIQFKQIRLSSIRDDDFELD